MFHEHSDHAVLDRVSCRRRCVVEGKRCDSRKEHGSTSGRMLSRQDRGEKLCRIRRWPLLPALWLAGERSNWHSIMRVPPHDPKAVQAMVDTVLTPKQLVPPPAAPPINFAAQQDVPPVTSIKPNLL